jgi:hypothetical protein
VIRFALAAVAAVLVVGLAVRLAGGVFAAPFGIFVFGLVALFALVDERARR